MSDGILEYYKIKYPNCNFETLVHGFNIPDIFYEPMIIDVTVKRKFAYTGSLNESCRDAAVRLAKVIVSNSNFELHIFGKANAAIFESYGVMGENVRVYGFLSDKEFHEKLKNCDIMLLPHGFDGARSKVEYETIFPTRTIPLLYSGRPILAHSPKGVYLTNFLLKNECALNVSSKSTTEIRDAINRLLQDENVRNKLIINAINTSKMFKVENVVSALMEQINAKN